MLNDSNKRRSKRLLDKKYIAKKQEKNNDENEVKKAKKAKKTKKVEEPSKDDPIFETSYCTELDLIEYLNEI